MTPQQVPSLETSLVLTPDHHQDTTGTAPVLCTVVPGVLNDESPAGPRDSYLRSPGLPEAPVTPRSRALQRPLVRVRGAGERSGRALILVLPVSSRVDRVVLRGGATIGAGDNQRVTSVGRRTIMAIPWSSPSYSRYRGPVDRGQPPQGTMTANNHQVLFHPSKF